MEDSLIYSEKLQIQFVAKLEHTQLIKLINQVNTVISDLQNLRGGVVSTDKSLFSIIIDSYIDFAKYNKEMLREELKRKKE